MKEDLEITSNTAAESRWSQYYMKEKIIGNSSKLKRSILPENLGENIPGKVIASSMVQMSERSVHGIQWTVPSVYTMLQHLSCMGGGG